MVSVAGVSSEPVGRFHAITVRDGASRERDGHPVYSIRKLNDEYVEVLFADGVWMLGSPTDVERF